MLLRQNTRCERISGVSVQNRHDRLRQDRAVVQFGGDFMHCRSGKLTACLYRPLMGMQAGKRGQQRGMDVEQPPGEVAHETGCEDAHEARQNDEAGGKLIDAGRQSCIESFAAGKGFVIQDAGRNALRPRKNQAFGIRFVADHGSDPRAKRLFPVLDLRRFDDGRHIGAAARNQNHDVFHTSCIILMPMQTLTPTEARVLGTLMEKARTVPDSYPLSLNTLVLGCNQKTSRDPIMEVSDDDAQAALQALKLRSLVFEASSSRVARYEHNVYRALGVSDDQGAILGLLMLRGPQTPAELRTNGERWTKFADSAAVEKLLEELRQRGEDGGLQTVVKLPKMPGAREHRWAHLLCGEVDIAALSASASSFVATDDSLGRLTKLENEVAQLKASNAQLQATLRHVCDQLGIDVPAEQT